MHGKGRNSKGSKGELQVAKLLQAWWRQLDPQARMVRVPRSGGWVYGPEFGACGDVMAKSDPAFPFSVEVKRQENWKLNNLVSGRPSPVWGWWRQCQGDAQKAGKEPMLWFRQNNRPWMVLLRKRFAARCEILAPDVAWPPRLRFQVDCGLVPVLYLGDNLLKCKPGAFLVPELKRIES